MLKPSFLFRIRNPLRDQQTDAERFGRLASLIDRTIAEVASEQSGLEGRYKASQSDAALLLDASENEEVSEQQASTRLASLEQTLIACERRLKDLGGQQELLNRLRGEIEPLLVRTTNTAQSDGADGKSG